MKTLLVASLAVTLFTAPAAFAFEWPVNQPIRGTEGPDVHHAASQPVEGVEGPDVRHSQSLLRLSGLEWPDVR